MSFITGTVIFSFPTTEWDSAGKPLPFTNTSGQLVLSTTSEVISGTYTIVSVPFSYNNGISPTGDGLSYADAGFSGFLSNTDQDLTQFDGIPLSSNGSQFANYKGTIGINPESVTATLGVPTIFGTNLSSAFLNTTCDFDLSSWNTSTITNMDSAFENSLINHSLNSWDVSNVENMNRTFYHSIYNQPLNDWDVSSVWGGINLGFTSTFAFSAFNHNISNWTLKTADGNNLWSMAFMFESSAYNKPLTWNFNITTLPFSTIEGMFKNAAFNQNIGSWDVSGIDNMKNMFDNCAISTTNFNSLLNGWNANLSTPTYSVEVGSEGLTYSSTGLPGWNGLIAKNITFPSATLITESFVFTIKSSDWDGLTYPLITNDGQLVLGVVTIDTSTIANYSIVTIPYTFTDNGTTNDGLYYNGFFSSVVEQDITSFDGIPLSRTNNGDTFRNYKGTLGQYSTVASVTLGVPTVIGTNFNNTFKNTTFNADINGWDVSGVTQMVSTFNTSQINNTLDNWDVNNVLDMTNMFSLATEFNQDLSYWYLSNITDMTGMLDNCGLSETNYDLLLNGWATNSNTPNTINLGAIGLTYSPIGKVGRDILTDVKNWTITGDQYIPCFHETTTVLCLSNGKEEYRLITELKVGDFVKTYKDGYRKVKMTHTYKCTNLPENELNRFYVMDKSVNPIMTHDLVITGGHSILVDECDMTDENIRYMNKCKMKYLVVQDKRKELACINSNFVGKNDGSVENVYVLVLDNNDVEKVYGIFVNGGVLVESSSQTVCKKKMDKTKTIKTRKFKLC